MFGQRKKLIVSKKDMDQAILAKNKSILSKNKSILIDIESNKSEVESLKNDIQACISEQKVEKVEIARLYSESLSASKEKIKVDSQLRDAKFKESKVNKSVEDLELKAKEILLSVDIMDIDLNKKAKERDEIAAYIKGNDYIEGELKSGQARLEVLGIDIGKSESEYQALSLILDIEREKNADKLGELALEKEDCIIETDKIKKEHSKMQLDLDNKSKEYSRKKEHIKAEVLGLESLIKELKKSCSTLDLKIIEKENDIKRAEFQAEKIEEESANKVSNIKIKYEGWKITVLASLAKLQLKGKINDIDKAGLSEILNG